MGLAVNTLRGPGENAGRPFLDPPAPSHSGVGDPTLYFLSCSANGRSRSGPGRSGLVPDLFSFSSCACLRSQACLVHWLSSGRTRGSCHPSNPAAALRSLHWVRTPTWLSTNALNSFHTVSTHPASPCCLQRGLIPLRGSQGKPRGPEMSVLALWQGGQLRNPSQWDTRT